MDWFDGSIAHAIQSAKASNSLFVVVVHGPEDDETSKKFLEVLDDPEIHAKLKKAVCIKVQNGTQPCNQFSALYPVILVPSIYFINSQNGQNIETTGGQADKDKVVTSIDKAFKGFESEPAAQTSAEDVVSPRNNRVEQARQVLQNEVQPTSEDDKPSTPTSGLSLEERVERAKKLLAEKQAQKAKESGDKEKTSEAQRRELGQNMQELKRKQQQDEIRQAAEERQKEKEEQRLALIKIKEQIAQDRAERAEKFNKEKTERDEKRKEKERERLAEEAKKAEQLAAERSTVARIQFRLPNGSAQTHRFDPEDTVGDLYKFVIDQMQTTYGSNISLSTTFPSRNLDSESTSTTLRQAGLVPSTTVLVLAKNRGGTVSQSTGNIMDYVWLLLTPLTAIWAFLTNFLSGGRDANQGAFNSGQERPNEGRKRQADSSAASGSSTAYKRRSGGVKTEGNIARLSNDDDDDESNTYNGNSTQQM